MFRRIRVALLLYVLLFVAVGTYLTQTRVTDWNEPLWVNVYAAPADDARAVDSTIAAEDLAAIESFFTSQARAYGLGLERPFRFHAAGVIDAPLPSLPVTSSFFAAIAWSLRMRWRVAMLNWSSDAPTPDIVLLVVHHELRDGLPVERSGALRKGLIAVAHVIAEHAAREANRVVMAHEVLHTLGATDKYDPVTNMPIFPFGYAEPDRAPLHPQDKAELMGGRVPRSPREAEIPRDLSQVVIGPATALEIGWTTTLQGAARQHE